MKRPPIVSIAGAALFITLMYFTGRASAEPLLGEVVRLPESDGSFLVARVWGDEYDRVFETLDGYTIIRDPVTNLICYAELDGTGEIVSTGVNAKSPVPNHLANRRGLRADRAQRNLRIADQRSRLGASNITASPSSQARMGGQFRGLCLLIDFEDDVSTLSPAQINDLFNKPGYTGFGNNGSVRDYYLDVSFGSVDYSNHVMPYYYRAQQSKIYYSDQHIPVGIRARELVLEALAALLRDGFDFSQVDANDDGVIDGIQCLYAGSRFNEWGEGLWPHTWTVTFSSNGTRTGKYSISDLQDTLRLSTICHETGHLLFSWPDLYDFGLESAGVGKYCIMGGNLSYTSNTNPQWPSAYVRDLAGWPETVMLTEDLPNGILSIATNRIYRIQRPNHATEYFLLENRQRAGRDVGLPDDGIALWHIDRAGDNSQEEMTPSSHYEVRLVQSDGRNDLELNNNYGDTTDLWSAPDRVRFDDTTNPPAKWWDRADAEFRIHGISASGPQMAFSFVNSTDCNDNDVDDSVDLQNGTSDDCNENDHPDECDIDEGGSADCNNNGIPDSCEGVDCNGNGRLDACDVQIHGAPDCNTNLRPDSCDIASGVSTDCNNNAKPDSCEMAGADCNSNGRFDACDVRLHGAPDCNTNLRPDSCDIASGVSTDCNTNAMPDSCEMAGNDCNSNGRFDPCDVRNHGAPDCNTNLRPDSCDIASGVSTDCNTNAMPDSCEMAGADCNSNGRFDACDVRNHGAPDCNTNLRPDSCDIASGISTDCNQNAKPDSCEMAGNDCNSNGRFDPCDVRNHGAPDCNTNLRPDSCDIASGVSTDCNTNAMPDSCEMTGADCNSNGRFDACDVRNHGAPDCNLNLRPDSCDIASGVSTDCNTNAMPDSCEMTGADCNSNGRFDACDVRLFGAPDCNLNVRPDSCDIASGISTDCNTNAMPDSCEMTGADCNSNGRFDACDVRNHGAPDCNLNLRPDSCDIASGVSTDCNTNAMPDSCEMSDSDCNLNSSLDDCDIDSGASTDDNGNAIPDECEAPPCTSIPYRKFYAQQPAANTLFGFSVAAEGPQILMGSYGLRFTIAGQGSASRGRFQNGNFIPEQTFQPPAGLRNSLFGAAVALESSVAVVGAPNSQEAGAVVVYRAEAVGPWRTLGVVMPQDLASGDGFGYTLALEDAALLVSSIYDDDRGLSSGSAYVFEVRLADVVQRAKLLAPDGHAGEVFGSSVAISPAVAIVGAEGSRDTPTGPRTGAAYIFRRNGNAWAYEAKLLPLDGAQFDYFGHSVCLVSDFAFVGSPLHGGEFGAVYVFRWNGTAWNQVQKLTAFDDPGPTGFGNSLSAVGDTLLVGMSHPIDNNAAGAAYVFRRHGAAWFPKGKLIGDQATTEQGTGHAIALSESGFALLGAYEDDAAGRDAGAGFLYFGVTKDCNRNVSIDLCDLRRGDSLDADGNGIPDECPTTAFGDFDGDGSLSLVDVGGFIDCMADLTLVSSSQSASASCLPAFDADEDGDVDLKDYSNLQAAFGD